jgi:indole-3-glycerol phosphate synthase
MNILEKIIQHKTEEIKEKSRITPLERIKGSQRLFSIRDFKSVLMGDSIKVIAEIKKQSPSEGDIMIGANPAEIAVEYEKNGASAISVLTDSHFFGGQLEYIQQVKNAIDIPVLRKDFIISEYQIWESFQAGADAILLIADAIEKELLVSLYELAKDLGLHVLIETHNSMHLSWINNLNPQIVGINCRDLQTMKTDLNLLGVVAEELSADCIKVAESGIYTSHDLSVISDYGYNAALVGTSLMKTGEPGNALAALLNRVSV